MTDGDAQTMKLKKLTLALPEGGERYFFHRDSDADKGVVAQIFHRTDYSLRRLARGRDIIREYDQILKSSKTPLVIDAGANIGASVVWFQSEFPKSHVLAFEPDEDNFNLLQENAQDLNVDLRLAAIGSADGRVDIANPESSSWGFRTIDSANGSRERLSMSRMIEEKQAEGYQPLIVKIDIEGGEEELFSQSTDWVNDIPLIIVELHDWLYPQKRTAKNFLTTIAPLNRDFVHIGENIFSIRNTI